MRRVLPHLPVLLFIMAKDPAFLFYPNDWLGGTMGMTFEEKGAYMELLMLQFNRGHMTKDMIGRTVGQLWVNIQDKFVEDKDGCFYNVRLEEEKNKRKAFSESRRNNRKGVNQYTKKKEHKSGHMTSHMENVNEDVNSNQIGKDFEIFFEAYGKKLDQVLCQREWMSIDRPEHAKILEHVKRYVAATPEIKYRKKPINYLKDRTWLDPELPNQHQEPKKETYKPNLIFKK
jgi:uncharacterized protein YdaU (DUF1376 family)